MSIERIVELWNEDSDWAFLQTFLVGLFFLACNFGLFCAMWFMRKGALFEYGYPKRKAKNLNKRFKKYSFVEKLFLVRVVKEAECQGFYSYFSLLLNFANIAAFCVSLVGYIGALVTCISGWAAFLLITPVFGIFVISVAISFIPDLICLPSERRRYKWKK